MGNPLLENVAYRDIYDKLFKLAKPKETALPFVTLVSSDWGTASRKVLWYGGATDGWTRDNWPDGFDIDFEHADGVKWLEEEFSDRNMKSPFWRVQKACLAYLGLEIGDAPWGNIYRIGGLHGELRGMPTHDLREMQADLCVEAFNIEREELEPDLVVLHVGELVNPILDRLGGSWSDWKKAPHDKKLLAAYNIHEGQKLIWMSRRIASDADYVEAFAWCCAQMDIIA